MKLKLIDTHEDKYNGDNEFYWRQSMRGMQSVNVDVEEMASDMYRNGNYEGAKAAFKLLTDSFPNYAEGHNYLGLIHLECGELAASIEHFRKTARLGRKMFPKRIRKDLFWRDLNTRPYMRGLQNLGLALIRSESYEEVLMICDTLEKECNDYISATSHRAAVFLNTEKWSQAEENALKIFNMMPMMALIAAFSQFEQGKLLDARTNFLFAAFNNPLGIEIVLKGRARKPRDPLEAAIYNYGIEMRAMLGPYLTRRSSRSRTFFSSLLTHADVSELIEEVLTCADLHFKSQDQSKHHANFARWKELKSLKFCRKKASFLT